MCQDTKSSRPAAIREIESVTKNSCQQGTKLAFRINPFRRIAKTARINLNRYWSLLSTLNRHATPSESDIEATFAAELEQNRINELLEERSRLSSSNSLTTCSYYGHGDSRYHWESDIHGRGPLLSFHHDTVTPSPPPPMRRYRIAKRSLYSPTFSTSTAYTESTHGSNDSLFI